MPFQPDLAVCLVVRYRGASACRAHRRSPDWQPDTSRASRGSHKTALCLVRCSHVRFVLRSSWLHRRPYSSGPSQHTGWLRPVRVQARHQIKIFVAVQVPAARPLATAHGGRRQVGRIHVRTAADQPGSAGNAFECFTVQCVAVGDRSAVERARRTSAQEGADAVSRAV